MIRPELHEMKSTIKQLKKDAEMRLTLDVEAQQSFEFLSDQVEGPTMWLPWSPRAGSRAFQPCTADSICHRASGARAA